ncbi:hypothetical protein VTO42DRAFT_626 [Malbranchea cinnamomea]
MENTSITNYILVHDHSRFSLLERAPAELLRSIFNKVEPRDLRNLLLVSKTLHASAMSYLYEAVTYEVNCDDAAFLHDLQRLHRAGTNLKLVRSLAITIAGSPNRKKPLPENVSMSSTGFWKDGYMFYKACDLFNQHIVKIVQCTPFLRHFRLESVQIRVLEPQVNAGQMLIPRKLKSIATGGSYDLYQSYLSRDVLTTVVRKAIEERIDTLEELAVGQESWAAQSYRVSVNYLRSPAPWYLDDALAPATASRQFSSLKKLRVISFNLRVTHPQDQMTLGQVFRFDKLRSLTLESCFGSAQFLGHLARLQGSSAMNLKEFVFRHEDATPTLVAHLEAFLCSFSGLEVLSILMDNTDEHANLPNHERILKLHGLTLKVLVWCGRKRHRPSGMVSSEQRVAGRPSFLECLATYCSDIRELSINLDVNTDYLSEGRWRRIAYGTPFFAIKFPRLTTLHIQALPCVNRLAVDPFFIAHANKAAITKYLDWSNIYFGRDKYPSLKLIAVGPLNYMDRYLLNRPTRMRTKVGPAWPIFYDVTGVKNNFGCYDHILQTLGNFDNRQAIFINENVNNIQQMYPNTRIFDFYWLK